MPKSKAEKLLEELEHRTPYAEHPIIAGDNIADVFSEIDHDLETMRELLAEVVRGSGTTA